MVHSLYKLLEYCLKKNNSDSAQNVCSNDGSFPDLITRNVGDVGWPTSQRNGAVVPKRGSAIQQIVIETTGHALLCFVLCNLTLLANVQRDVYYLLRKSRNK